jgi:CheY-like chemotaxis protein
MAQTNSLTAAGFSVIEAWSTDDVLSYLESRSDIRLVISDADMPGSLSGVDLALFITKRWPNIEIIIWGPAPEYTASLPPPITVMPKSSSASELVNQVRTKLASILRRHDFGSK